MNLNVFDGSGSDMFEQSTGPWTGSESNFIHFLITLLCQCVEPCHFLKIKNSNSGSASSSIRQILFNFSGYKQNSIVYLLKIEVLSELKELCTIYHILIILSAKGARNAWDAIVPRGKTFLGKID